MRLSFALLAVLAAVWPVALAAQDDPNDTPLGDVARGLRKKTPAAQDVIDDDNLPDVMEQVEGKHAAGSALKFLMTGETHGFHVSAPDVTCSLSFSANTKALLSSQYAQMDLPPGDVAKLSGPATIEGDAIAVSLFNGTGWHVSEVAVALTIVKKKQPRDASASPGTGKLIPDGAGSLASESEVRPEKKADVTVIYRMRSAASPWTNTVVSAPLDLELTSGDDWHWAIVQAKGYPPRSYSATTQTARPTILQPTPPLELSLPPNSSRVPQARNPQ